MKTISIIFAVCLGIIGVCAADGLRESGILRALPKVAGGADGFVEVIAADVPGDPVGFRLPILQFTTKLIRDVERIYSLEMPGGSVGILIHAQDGMTNDVRVVTRAVRRDGRAMTHVWLPSPGFSDLTALRFAVVKAYLNCWVDRNRVVGVAAATVPDWFVLGAMRSLDTDVVRSDKQAILTSWSEARLAFFPLLCANPLRHGGSEACGYLVSWLREKKLFKETLLHLAGGKTLTGAHLAQVLTDEKTPDLQDRASDERLAKLTRTVLTPGHASEWDLKVFTSRLLIFSSEFDKNIHSNSPSCSFREAIALSGENPEVRNAAARKAREMLFAAIGRGPELSGVAESYRIFLTALARGESPDELTRLLDEAEMQLQEILNEDRKDNNR